MSRKQASNFHHSNFVFPIEDGLQLLITVDLPLVCWVLELVGLDVLPDLLDGLRAGDLRSADELLQRR